MAEQLTGEPTTQVEFGLLDVQLEMFAIQARPQPDPPPPVGVGLSVELGFRPEAEEVLIRLQVGMGGERMEDCFLRAITRNIFRVRDLKAFASPDGTYQLPRAFVATLFSVSYSTMRGILIGKGAGVSKETILLPLVDPQALLSQLDAASAPSA